MARFISRLITLDHRPWPKYWHCVVDTGKKFVKPGTTQVFYQNFDEEFYSKMSVWCEREFSRCCRISYNTFYFKSIEELKLFEERWR